MESLGETGPFPSLIALLPSAKWQVPGKRAPFRLTVSVGVLAVEDGNESSTPAADC
jgi:hypothetical protein